MSEHTISISEVPSTCASKSDLQDDEKSARVTSEARNPTSEIGGIINRIKADRVSPRSELRKAGAVGGIYGSADV